MKPPLRRRLAPARYVTSPGAAAAAAGAGGVSGGGAWSAREKRALLGALRAQAALGAAHPDPRRLRERLPGRSEEEVRALVSQLRGRAAREALRSEFRLCLEERRRAGPPAPIEVWTDLAEALGEGLDGAAAAAFSQVLTVAGTEPMGGGPERCPPPPELPVDFERLYGHLALLARGGPPPPTPPPAEAAVLVALLAALPPELPRLALGALGCHLRGAFGALVAPRDEEPPPGDVTASTDTKGTPPGDVTVSGDTKETPPRDVTVSGDTKGTPPGDVILLGDTPRDKATPPG